MQDPERYLKDKHVQVPCAVDGRRPARLEPEYRAQINHEVYFFSAAAARARFGKDPLRYCGLLTDPVSRARFHPNRRSPRLEFKGRPYYFQNRIDLETFAAMPDSFANRRGM